MLLGGGYFFRDYIQHFLNFFIVAVDEWGPLGYAAYAGVYIVLEVSGEGQSILAPITERSASASWL